MPKSNLGWSIGAAELRSICVLAKGILRTSLGVRGLLNRIMEAIRSCPGIPLPGSGLIVAVGRLLAVSLAARVILACRRRVLAVACLLIYWLVPIVHSCLSCGCHCGNISSFLRESLIEGVLGVENCSGKHSKIRRKLFGHGYVIYVGGVDVFSGPMESH